MVGDGPAGGRGPEEGAPVGAGVGEVSGYPVAIDKQMAQVPPVVRKRLHHRLEPAGIRSAPLGFAVDLNFVRDELAEQVEVVRVAGIVVPAVHRCQLPTVHAHAHSRGADRADGLTCGRRAERFALHA
jgi:hypothetical protein